MLRLIQTLTKTLHAHWRTMGSSSYMALFVLVAVAYLALSLQLLVEFIRSRMNRGLTKHDDMRAIQSFDAPPPPPHFELPIPHDLSFRSRIGQSRRTVTRYQHDTEQRVDRRVELLRKRIVARRTQHA